MRLLSGKRAPLRLYSINAHAPICGVLGYSNEYTILVPLIYLHFHQSIRLLSHQFYQINFANYENMEGYKRIIPLMQDSFHLQPKLADENINKLKKLKSLYTPNDPLFTIE